MKGGDNMALDKEMQRHQLKLQMQDRLMNNAEYLRAAADRLTARSGQSFKTCLKLIELAVILEHAETINEELANLR